MALPYVLFARGLREIGTAEAGLIALVEPILNPIWVVLFVGERPTIPTLLGGLFSCWAASPTATGRSGHRRRSTSPANPAEIDRPASAFGPWSDARGVVNCLGCPRGDRCGHSSADRRGSSDVVTRYADAPALSCRPALASRSCSWRRAGGCPKRPRDGSRRLPVSGQEEGRSRDQRPVPEGQRPGLRQAVRVGRPRGLRQPPRDREGRSA